MSSKIREALEFALFDLESSGCDESTYAALGEDSQAVLLHKQIKAALAEPLRNCDVGTVAEQTERFKEICKMYHCNTCPLNRGTDCTLTWAQMPYKKEGQA